MYDGSAHGASGSCKDINGAPFSSGLSLGGTFTNVPGGTATWVFDSPDNNYSDAGGTVPIVLTKAPYSFAACTITPYNVPFDGLEHQATSVCTGPNTAPSGERFSLDLSSTRHSATGSYTDTWTFSGGRNYQDATGTVTNVITFCTLLSTQNSSYPRDSYIDVPVYAADLTDGNLQGISFALSYDPRVLEPVFFSPPDSQSPYLVQTATAGTMSSGGNFQVIANRTDAGDGGAVPFVPGKIEVSISSNLPAVYLQGSGVLVKIKMHVKSDAAANSSTTLALSNVLPNEGGCNSASSGTMSVVRSDTSVEVSSSAPHSPAVYGDSVTFSSAVSSTTTPNPPVNGGSVTVNVFSMSNSGTTPDAACTTSSVASGSASCSISGLHAGQYRAIGTYSDGTTNYNDSSSSQITFTVDPHALLITASSPSSIVYGSDTPVVNALYRTGDLQYGETSIDTPATCGTTYLPGRVRGGNVGSHPTECVGGSDPDYSITYATGSFSVTPKPLSITASSITITFGTTPSPVISPLYDGLYTNSANPSYSDTQTFTAPTCSSVYSTSPFSVVSTTPYRSYCETAADNNYSIAYSDGGVTVAKASSSTVISCPGSPFVFKGADWTPCTATVTGAGGLSTTTGVTYSNNFHASTSSSGPATADASYIGDDNHLSSTADRVTFTIDPAPVTITAGSGSSVFNGNARTPSDCVTSGTSPATFTGTVSCSNDPSSVGPGAGTTTINPVAAVAVGDRMSNYAFTLNSGSYTISPAPVTITAGGGSSTYDGVRKTPSACAVTGTTPATFTGTVTCVNDPIQTTSANAGDYTFSPVASAGSGDSLSNYDITSVSGTYTIGKANAICTITPYDAAYDNAPHSATGTCSGVESSPTDLTPLLTINSNHTEPGTYTDSWSFAGDTNYFPIASTSFTNYIRTGTVSGTVSLAITPATKVDGVTLTSTGGSVVTPAAVTTSSTGAFSITKYGAGDYTITPSRAAQPCSLPSFQGITSSDATLVAKAVVNAVTLTPSQRIAADVSTNGAVTSLDASFIAQKVVQSCVTGNHAGEWRFVDPSVQHNPLIASSSTGVGGVQNKLYTDNFGAIMLGDVNGSWTTGQARQAGDTSKGDAVLASLGTVKADGNSVVSIPLSLTGLRGRGVDSFQFDVTYDPKVLTPDTTAVDLTGTRSVGQTAVWNAAQPGLIRVVVFGANTATEEGIFANLSFRTTEGSAGSAVKIAAFALGDESVPVTVTDGNITVVGNGVKAATGSLVGYVKIAEGRGVPSANVVLIGAGGQEASASSSPIDGSFEFKGLVVGGTYIVSVKVKGRDLITRTVTIADNVAEIDLVLPN